MDKRYQQWKAPATREPWEWKERCSAWDWELLGSNFENYVTHTKAWDAALRAAAWLHRSVFMPAERHCDMHGKQMSACGLQQMHVGSSKINFFPILLISWYLTQFYSLDTFHFSAPINDTCSLEIISVLILSLSGASKITDTRMINALSISKAWWNP